MAVDDFSRGALTSPAPQRTLFDPTRPVSTPPIRLEFDERPRRPPRADLPIRRADASVKKLFNPDIHDPHSFHPRPVDPGRDGNSGSLRSVLQRQNGRIPEEQADRERERQKRREGTERGIQASKRKEPDAKSKGSRSSEGSESLKDRERGKGKG